MGHRLAQACLLVLSVSLSSPGPAEALQGSGTVLPIPLHLDVPIPPPPPKSAAERSLEDAAMARVAELNQGAVPGFSPTLLRAQLRETAEARTEDLMEAFAHSGDPALRQRALEAGNMPEDSLGGLAAALVHPSPEVRSAGLERLQAMDEPGAALSAALLRHLASEAGGEARVLDTVLSLEPQLGPPLLERAGRSQGNRMHRLWAVYLLGRMRHAPASALLAGLCQEDDLDLARLAALSLSTLNNPEYFTLWTRMAAHRDQPMRELAFDALARLGSPRAAAFCHAAALGSVPLPADAPALGLQALAYWPIAEAVPNLVSVMANSPAMAARAGDLLRQRTGMEFPDNPETWHAWYEQGMPAQAPPPTLASPMPSLEQMPFVLQH